MAKSVVTFTDNADGGVSIEIAFEPELHKGQATTIAQKLGVELADGFGKLNGALDSWTKTQGQPEVLVE